MKSSISKAGLAIGSALLLAACSGGGGGSTDASSSGTGGGVTAPKVTPTPTPTPYGPVLSGSIDPVSTALTQAAGSKDLNEFGTALTAVSTSAQTAATTLGRANKPAAVATDQTALVAALKQLAKDATTVRSDIKSRGVCALSSAGAELGASQGLADVSAALGKLTAAGYSTTFAAPQLPKQQSRSLDNGTMVSKGKLRGDGEFKVDNGSKTDAVVSLVLNGRAVHSMFVAKGQKADIQGVEDGTYDVYVSQGADWDSATKAFTQSCAFTKFEDNFPFETGRTSTSWSITLQPVVDGNAKTNDVDPNSFPQL